MERAVSFLRLSSNVSTLYREPAMMQREILQSDGASILLRIRARTAYHWQLAPGLSGVSKCPDILFLEEP